MLVAMFNAVKVESVPLKSMFFAAARRPYARAIIGDRELMPINARPGLLVAGAVAAALPIAAVLIVFSTGSTPTATDETRSARCSTG